MHRPSLNALGVTFAIILGLITGPVVFYAFAGDYWHSTNLHLSQWIAVAAAVPLLIAALANATRFREAGMAGAITGLAGGVGEMAVAVVPWAGLTYRGPKCQPNLICPQFNQGNLTQLTLTVGIFSVIVFTLAGLSLAVLISALRQRTA